MSKKALPLWNNMEKLSFVSCVNVINGSVNLAIYDESLCSYSTDMY